ncbi:MAG: hypothetical protein AAB223_04315 [Pseudomonadota bacterium]
MSLRTPSLIRAGGLAAALALGACAGAGSTIDDFDPTQIRIITPTEATSKCIGDPSTPLCAIETTIGCARHVWNEGCPRVAMNFRRNNPSLHLRIEYVILKAGFVNKDKVEIAQKPYENEEFGRYPWLTADAFQARHLWRECSADRSSCEGIPWKEKISTVAPLGKYWTNSHGGEFDPEDWFVD